MSEAKPQLHISALNQLNFCGEQFRRRYIEKEIIPPGVRMLVGTATDKSVTRNLGNKIEKGELLSLEEVRQTAVDSLKGEWEKGVELDDDEAKAGMGVTKGAAIDKAVRLSSLHATDKAPTLAPTHVQRSWVVELSGFPLDLAGTIDVQEGSYSIRDTKTKGTTPAKDIADHDHQLTAYAMAARVIDGVIPEVVALDCLVDLKTPKAVTFSSTRTEEDFKAFLARVENAALALERGVFIPAKQSDYMCSPKYCGYFGSCKFVMQPKTFQIGGSK